MFFIIIIVFHMWNVLYVVDVVVCHIIQLIHNILVDVHNFVIIVVIK